MRATFYTASGRPMTSGAQGPTGPAPSGTGYVTVTGGSLDTVVSKDSVKPLFARVTGSDATRTAQTLADITGLSVALEANAVYEFTAVLGLNSSSTAGIQLGVQHSNSSGVTIEAQLRGSTSSATAQRQDRISALNTATGSIVTVAGNGVATIHGIIVTSSNAGNLTIQYLKVTSGTATVRINSFLRARRVDV